MKIAVLGAGFSGLTAAYELSKLGYEIHLFEKNSAVGGAAGGFKNKGWDWYLDYAYHHSFTNEQVILNTAAEIGFKKFLVRRPETASLYVEKKESLAPKNDPYQYLFGDKTSIHKLDSPIDLLKFGRLPFLDRLRTGLVLAILKFGPMLGYYNRVLAKDFLAKSMGEKASKVLWEPLFLKKFAGHYPKINMGFFWARLRRTPDFTYPEGGYQALANHFLKVILKKKVRVHLETEVQQISLKKGKFVLNVSGREELFDKVINTLQTPLFLKIGGQILPPAYRKRLETIRYLGAQSIIIESEEKMLPSTYWLSIAGSNPPSLKLRGTSSHHPGLDWMVLVQQTNFIDKKYYNNKHLAYLAIYNQAPLDFEIKDPKLKQKYKIIQKAFIKYAQPLYTPEFVHNKPDFETPVPGLYFANMEQTYPFDRGTNHAIRVGREVVKRMVK